jgi:hypothetical protein
MKTEMQFDRLGLALVCAALLVAGRSGAAELKVEHL